MNLDRALRSYREGRFSDADVTQCTGVALGAMSPVAIKIAPAGIDANALKMPVNWALLALPVDIDVTS
jgi:hypothetical protein